MSRGRRLMGGRGAAHGDRRLARLPVRWPRLPSPWLELLAAAPSQADAANEIAECHADLINLRFRHGEAASIGIPRWRAARRIPRGRPPQEPEIRLISSLPLEVQPESPADVPQYPAATNASRPGTPASPAMAAATKRVTYTAVSSGSRPVSTSLQ